MIYLDATVFLHAALDEGPVGQNARSLLEDVAKGAKTAATATLTVDEVVCVLLRKGDRSTALAQGQRMLRLPNVMTLAVRTMDVVHALKLMKDWPLSPRDAIHAAVCLNNSIGQIASSDRTFDVVPGLTRL